MEQNLAFLMIAHGGDASSNFLQAINCAKEGDIEQAHKLVAAGVESITLAHKLQTDMIFAECNGTPQEINILLVHAQDHLMNAMLLKDLTLHLIELYARTSKGV